MDVMSNRFKFLPPHPTTTHAKQVTVGSQTRMISGVKRHDIDGDTVRVTARADRPWKEGLRSQEVR